MDERTEQRLLTGDFAASEHDAGMQLLHIVRAVIGQRVAFEIRPPVFVGIEFRGVAGKGFQVEPPASSQPQPQHPAAMGGQAIPDHDDRAVEVSQQVAQEVDNLFLADRPVQVEVQIPAQSVAIGRDRQPADGRDAAVMSRSLTHDRGLPSKRPGSANQGRQQKARFIDENQVGPATSGHSLDPRPILSDPRGDSLLVAFGRPSFWLLRGKNPTTPSPAEQHRHGNAPRISARSVGRFGGRSTGRWRSQMLRRLSADSQPMHAAGGRSTWAAFPAPARHPAQPHRCADTRAAIGRHFGAWSSTGGISRQDRNPADSGRRLPADVAQVARGFHVVSCFIESAISVCEHYFYRTQ